jgi:hypothetical protein
VIESQLLAAIPRVVRRRSDDINDWAAEFNPPLERFDIREYNTRLLNMYSNTQEAQQLSFVR